MEVVRAEQSILSTFDDDIEVFFLFGWIKNSFGEYLEGRPLHLFINISSILNEKEISHLRSSQLICYCHQVLVTFPTFSAIDEIKRFLAEYDCILVNRLETQTRQPALYFSAILIDHEQSFEIMKLLIDYGANPHFKDGYQQTILFYVCRDGKEKCLQLLL